MKKSKPKKEDIVVFAFKKGSQTRIEDTENSSYRFVDSSIEKMMAGYNVVSEKISISGYREDVVCYISSLINVYIKIYNLEIEKVEDFDPVDFDPDRDIENTVVYRM
jgi:hypothetical protein